MSTTSGNFQIKNYELTNFVFITTTNCAGIKQPSFKLCRVADERDVQSSLGCFKKKTIIQKQQPTHSLLFLGLQLLNVPMFCLLRLSPGRKWDLQIVVWLTKVRRNSAVTEQNITHTFLGWVYGDPAQSCGRRIDRQTDPEKGEAKRATHSVCAGECGRSHHAFIFCEYFIQSLLVNT